MEEGREGEWRMRRIYGRRERIRDKWGEERREEKGRE